MSSLRGLWFQYICVCRPCSYPPGALSVRTTMGSSSPLGKKKKKSPTDQGLHQWSSFHDSISWGQTGTSEVFTPVDFVLLLSWFDMLKCWNSEGFFLCVCLFCNRMTSDLCVQEVAGVKYKGRDRLRTHSCILYDVEEGEKKGHPVTMQPARWGPQIWGWYRLPGPPFPPVPGSN